VSTTPIISDLLGRRAEYLDEKNRPHVGEIRAFWVEYDDKSKGRTFMFLLEVDDGEQDGKWFLIDKRMGTFKLLNKEIP